MESTSRRRIETESARPVPPPGAIDRCYQILGCSSSDSIKTIKSQYRQLALKFHPDRLVAQGMPPEFARFSGKRFREIQEAYDQISKTRCAR